MKNTNPKVDAFFDELKTWNKELGKLRAIVLDCGLAEELKWRQPCYTFQDNNVVILGAFKENCVLSFFKGALLKDVKSILEKPGENTQAARVIRFTSVGDIVKLQSILKAYIDEAIAVEKAGLKVELTKSAEIDIPEELQNKFDKMPSFETAFNALTPGRQRAYVLYFSAAKQSKTRESRIEQYVQQIIDGKGMNDCTCGLSKRLPACDGSHKQIR